MFWPSSETTLVNNIGRVVSFGLFLPMMIYGLWLSLRQWRDFQLLYAFMLFYSIMHLLTWSMIRYRLPVDAVLLIFAALALDQLGSRLRIWVTEPAAGGETTTGLMVDGRRSL